MTTIIYYVFFKPTLQQDNTIHLDEVQKYKTSNYYYTIIYFMAVLVGQLVTNIFTIISKCGSSSFNNLILALVFTLLPWTLIFGVMLVMLLIYPSIKKGFADVVGYLVISGKAHEYIDEIMKLDPTISNKIYGKPEIFINILTPFNFNAYFGEIEGHLKQNQNMGNKLNYETIKNVKDNLFKLIVNKDNIGEVMWVIYTGILLIYIVQYYITSKSCSNDKSTLQDNYKKYVENKEETQNKQNAQTTTYSV
jgi:hypothetical protein